MIESSEGLRGLLLRNGIWPTGESNRDIKLAKKIMPKNYNEYLKGLKEQAK